MTTGSISIGSGNTDHYVRKSWSGTDGKFISGSPVWRPGYTKVTYRKEYVFEKLTIYVNRSKRTKMKRRTIYVPEKVYIPPKLIRYSRRRDLSWHPYSMEAVTTNRSKSVTLPGYYNPNDDTWPYVYLSSSATQSILNSVSQKAKGHSFNAAVSNAQIGLTLEMITSTVQRVARSILYIRKGQLPSAARVLLASPRSSKNLSPRGLTSKDVADAWLELQYGWRPLLKDVHDGAQAMAHIMNPARSSRFEVYGKTQKSSMQDTGYSRLYYEGFFSRRIICEMTEVLSTPRSLGLLDPLSVAWEILPFSFVADWFIPIGTYLDNVNTIPNISARYLVTDKREVKTEVSGYATWYTGARSHTRHVSISRTLSTSLPVPRPRFEMRESTSHFWNSLALLRQLV